MNFHVLYVLEHKTSKKYVQILWGLALYFLIMCIKIEEEKVRQDVTNYKLELKISKYMLVNFEFLILILNFEFWFWILKFWILYAVIGMLYFVPTKFQGLLLTIRAKF